MNDHDRAMEIAEQADLLYLACKDAEAKPLYERALALERSAAEAEQTQPSRGLMLASAGWLAVSAGQHEEAIRLAELGLAGDVCEKVANNLRHVASNARWRLEVR